MWRTALIGCGNIAGGYDEQSDDSLCQTHAQACRLLPDLELVSVCDRDAEKARRFAARWSAQSSHDDVREMLAQTGPDIVAICSPTSTHIDMLEMCLERPGIRAVICEKPAGFDSAHLAPWLPKFESAGIVLAVNYSRAYAPAIQQWRAKLGELGGCVEAVVDYGKGIFNYGSHAVQWLADWLGDITNVEAVAARAGTAIEDPNVDAAFHAGAVPVRLRGGVKDCFDVEFRCAKGVLRFFNFAYEGECGAERFSTRLDTVMLDVYSNLTARLEGMSSRLVEGREALTTLGVCAALAAQSRKFS